MWADLGGKWVVSHGLARQPFRLGSREACVEFPDRCSLLEVLAVELGAELGEE